MKQSHWSLTQFLSLLCHGFLHNWKDSSGILPVDSVIHIFKVGTLDDPLDLGKEEKQSTMTGLVIWGGGYSMTT